MLGTFNMLAWGWIQVGVILGLNVWVGEATESYSIFSNSSTSTSTSLSSTTLTSPAPVHTSSTTTTNPLDLITTCIPRLATIDPFSLLAPSLQSLPFQSQIEIILSISSRLDSIIVTFEAISKSELIGDSATSYLSSISSIVFNDASALLGPAAIPILKFLDIQTDPCLYSTCFNQYFDQSSSFDSANIGGSFFYTASPPCCDRCKLTAERVDVEYWPTPAPNPPVSTLIDEVNNITFVSPTVYARYTNLYANDLCGRVGRSIPFTRLAFAPDKLNTSYLPFPGNLASTFSFVGDWSKVNYADFDSPDCICTTNCIVNPINNLTSTYLCTPRLSVAPEVSALDPLWATCRDDLYGFFDPPIALPRREGLTGPKTTIVDSTPAGPNPTPTPTAPSPVDSPEPPITTPTSTPNVEPEPVTTTPPNSETSSSDIIDPPADATSTSAVPEPGFTDPVEPEEPTDGGGGEQPSATTITTDGSTIVISATTIGDQGPVPITIIGEVVTPDVNSNFVIGTQTLIPGGPAITISGTVISLGPGATEVVVATDFTTSVIGGTVTSASSILDSTSTESPPIEFTGGSRVESLSKAGAISVAGLLIFVALM